MACRIFGDNDKLTVSVEMYLVISYRSIDIYCDIMDILSARPRPPPTLHVIMHADLRSILLGYNGNPFAEGANGTTLLLGHVALSYFVDHLW